MIEFDPKWEYYVPSEEIEERVVFDPFSILRGYGRLNKNLGFRFCSPKNINRFEFYLPPEKPMRDEWTAWRQCKHCLEWFQASRKERKYCSNECSAYHRGRPKELENIKCGNCQQEFEPYYTGQKYCSRKCAGVAFIKKESKEGCPICGKEIVNGHKPKKYCSRRCLQVAVRRKYNRKIANASSNERSIPTPT